jgi:regulator of cell morphogenesis and NO signaling
MNNVIFSGNVKMSDLLMANGRLLFLLPCFGIDLGFGEKSVVQVCEECGVSVPLFLLVCNLYSFDNYVPNNTELSQVTIEEVVSFLQASHISYLESGITQVIKDVLYLAELDSDPNNKNMLAAFCEKYRHEAHAHIQYEEEVVFPHIRKVLAGEKSDYTINTFEASHKAVDTTLRDLRALIIKYVPHTTPIAECLPILINLYLFEYDLRKHALLEDTVLIPLVDDLINKGQNGNNNAGLSEREQQALAALACGLSNKEIADKLNISIHTVVSHRKNIILKTGIKTVQGLTLYAFINNLVTPKDLR